MNTQHTVNGLPQPYDHYHLQVPGIGVPPAQQNEQCQPTPPLKPRVLGIKPKSILEQSAKQEELTKHTVPLREQRKVTRANLAGPSTEAIAAKGASVLNIKGVSVSSRDALAKAIEATPNTNPHFEHLNKLIASIREDVVTQYPDAADPKKNMGVNSPDMPGWDPYLENAEDGLKEAVENTVLAFNEVHIKEGFASQQFIASTDEVFPQKKLPRTSGEANVKEGHERIAVKTEAITVQGNEKVNEDAAFTITVGDSEICGVFDGYDGRKASKEASIICKANYEKYLKFANGNIVLALQLLFHEVAKNLKGEPSGCQGILTCIDKKNGLMYTAALGSCEARIFRKFDGKTKMIPVSYNVDWRDQFEQKRAKEAGAKIVPWPPDQVLPRYKVCQFPNGHISLGSRALGDKLYSSKQAAAVLLTEPLISVYPVQKGDIVLTYSKGLKEIQGGTQAIVKRMDQSSENLIQALGKALQQHPTNSNATVVINRIS